MSSAGDPKIPRLRMTDKEYFTGSREDTERTGKTDSTRRIQIPGAIRDFHLYSCVHKADPQQFRFDVKNGIRCG